MGPSAFDLHKLTGLNKWGNILPLFFCLFYFYVLLFLFFKTTKFWPQAKGRGIFVLVTFTALGVIPNQFDCAMPLEVQGNLLLHNLDWKCMGCKSSLLGLSLLKSFILPLAQDEG